MTAVRVLAYEGVDELDLFGALAPLDKGARCTQHDNGLEVALVAPGSDVTTSGGTRLTGIASLDALADCDVLVVPGGRGAEAAAASERLRTAVRDTAARGAELFAVCTGVLLVAAAGVRAGRLAVHADKHQLLRTVAPGVREADIGRGLVRDPALVSIGGLADRGLKGTDIAFEVLRRHAPGCVGCVARRMEVVPPAL
ncbi:DJ-1/PfpI family protein [Streptomyces hygroscopicus]|uniref:DJ-1/PfpI family protein n=1 Tax=Streptomyces hygroscopicus TaxID=1912 RepID=UPI000767DB43|nr:DJ-1/PfpI family protein [Streptomyces hygroscopicus]